MSLLSTISARRCALCKKPIAGAFVESGALYCLPCWLSADPAAVEPAPADTTVRAWLRTHQPRTKRKAPPKRLYCFRRCQRLMPVEPDAWDNYRCVGCHANLWTPFGRAPTEGGSEAAPCRIVWHVGVSRRTLFYCLSCAGLYPDPQAALAC